ncbi:MAG: cobalamin-dependent protein [Candidatus Binatia bacterium]|jgi:methylmalonyl-CoA mutase cobalamin-binding domain/chain
MNEDARPIRVLFACDTSGHTAGYHVVARGLRDAGFEVILAGRQLPSESASAALQEGADVIAIRIMDRDPVEHVTAILEAMRAAGIGEVPLLAGGIIAKRDAEKLVAMGVAGVFRPGSKLSAIVECARNAVRGRTVPQ